MFEAAFYINLNHRTDRKIKFETAASKAGLASVERFSAISISTEECQPDYFNEGEKRKYKVGCTLSHIGVVQTAKNRGLKNVLVFEDDCVFLQGFLETVEKCYYELQNVEWDIIYFGGEPSNHCTPVTENVYTVSNGGVYCNHAYAVNHTFYDKFISISPFTTNVIDIALINYPTQNRKFMLSKKIVAIQEDNIFSDLEQHDKKAASQIMLSGWDKYVTHSMYNLK